MSETVHHFRWPIIGTSAYLVLMYVFMGFQSSSRVRVIKQILRERGLNHSGSLGFLRNDPEVVNHPSVIRGDRTFLNMLEQMPAFLVSTWMYAAFVDADVAGGLALAYTACRALYPFGYHNLKVLLPLSTVPGYAIIIYQVFHALIKAFQSF